MRTFYPLKAFFVMCVLCMTGTLCALAQTTVTFTAGTDKSSTSSITKDGVTILIEKGTSTAGAGQMSNNKYYGFYKGNDITISCNNGNITKIVFTCTAKSTSEKYGPDCFEAKSGQYTYASYTGTWTGDAASVPFTASKAQLRASKIEVTYAASSSVAIPNLSVATKTFSAPFDVTITAEDGADIYYTLDGTDPTTLSTKYNGSAINITKTTTLKAIAVKNGKNSNVVSATYTYVNPFANNGSFTSPYTAEEVVQNASALSGKDVWIRDVILGMYNNNSNSISTLNASSTNIVLGKEGSTNYLPIALKSYSNERIYCNANAEALMGKEIMFYGTIGTYFSRPGIPSKKVIAFSGTEDTPVATLSVKTSEGYATFVCDYEFYVPEGTVCSAITNASENGVLTTGQEFKADDIVPAKYPVLVKTDGPKTFNLIIPSGGANKPDETNLLKAGKGEDITAEAGHHYYKLAYDDFDTKEGLGFYWGAADGGAFYVPEGNAYLDVPSTSTTSVMSFRLVDAVTGIANPVVNGQTEKVAYTIDGRRVDASHLTKGLYIVNGKKVMVK